MRSALLFAVLALAFAACLLPAAQATEAMSAASMEALMEAQSLSEMQAQLEIVERGDDEQQQQQQQEIPVPAPLEIQQAPATTDPSGTTVAGSTPAGGEDASEVGLCEVCMYVVENKEQHQPYLCKGLKDPHYQNVCVQVMESLMWWVSNEVYWLNYGCQMNQNGAVSWVRPCPAHAVCSWLQHLYLRKPFCAIDKNFPKPA